MNEKLINNLLSLVEQIKNNPEKETTDKFRIKSIQNAISIIKNIPFEITSTEMLENTPGIGKGILTRIEEILKTGHLEEVHTKIPINLIKFQQAIGDSSAKKLYDQGIKNLDALRKAVKNGKIEVTHRIELILKYTYGKVKLEENIPRTEMNKINLSFNKVIKKFDPKLEYLMCGSYRREKNTSNDIDIILFHPEDKKILPSFISYLIEKKFLVDHLTNNISKLKTKYMGYCISTKDYVVRRIDIRLVDYQSRFTAILYFTGPRDFNTHMRLIAKKKGFKLNEYSLQIIKTKKNIYPQSEEEIFKLLDMIYLPPNKRV
jgi:DNA polymerase/3'-5' exonuclease PolX